MPEAVNIVAQRTTRPSRMALCRWPIPVKNVKAKSAKVTAANGRRTSGYLPKSTSMTMKAAGNKAHENTKSVMV